MPGRGQYWKVGGINDLHIVESDLDSALQAKLNAGGGALELLSSTNLAGSNSVTISAINEAFTGFQELILHCTWDVDTGANICKFQINGETASDYTNVRNKAIRGGASPVLTSGIADDSIFCDEANNNGSPQSAVLKIKGTSLITASDMEGELDVSGQNSTPEVFVSKQAWEKAFDLGSTTQITEIKIFTDTTNNFATGSVAKLYKLSAT